jgi:DNA polymerase-3 subunit epsilon/ATP-dependent DNA helicase DinG
LGISISRSHRALDDAQTARQLLLVLMERLDAIDPLIINQIAWMASKAGWGIQDLFSEHGPRPVATLEGIDFNNLSAKEKNDTEKGQSQSCRQFIPEEISSMADSESLLSKCLSGFEYRPQQVDMIYEVSKAFDDSRHLIIEAGTGVGKSLAYLLPSIMFAVTNGSRVVISTNTINLQEQLLSKDIPELLAVLETNGHLSPGEVKVASLKGRDNYVCVRRLASLFKNERLQIDEARLLSKCLVWLKDSMTGDRGEITLGPKDGGVWERISAGDKGICPGLREGACFLKYAREKADNAQIVVVNHSLLLSDMTRGGSLIPEYQHLVIDEAHRLEDEATRQLGWEVSQGWLTDHVERLSNWLNEMRTTGLRFGLSKTQMSQLESLVFMAEESLPKLRGTWSQLWAMFEGFFLNQTSAHDQRAQVRLTNELKSQSGWSSLDMTWGNCDISLRAIESNLERLNHYIELIDIKDQGNWDTLAYNVESWSEEVSELRMRLESTIGKDVEDDRIDWITQKYDSTLTLHSVPMRVDSYLEKGLFEKKDMVVLCGATLSIGEDFNFIRSRLGLKEADEVSLGSPFDYEKAALVIVPKDVPQPGVKGYKETVESGLASIVNAVNGHTLALFTSHAALRAARQTLIDTVEGSGINVLAQGIDGSAHRVVQRFIERPRSILLGTSSLWEGIDVPDGLLKALVLVRLPFNVPTDPIFSARSEQYQNSFVEYALPQAVLKFRQGFGRLIRNSKDRGVVVVMDSRVLNKAYGHLFLDSLPPCTFKTGSITLIGDYISNWWDYSNENEISGTL